METLKILMLTTFLDINDGIRKHVAELAKSLSEKGHEVHVLGLIASPAYSQPIMYDILKGQSNVRLAKIPFSGKREATFFIKSIKSFVNKKMEFDPDVIHAHAAAGAVLPFINVPVPKVITPHGIEFIRFFHKLKLYRAYGTRLFGPRELVKELSLSLKCGISWRFAYSRADAIIVFCKWMKNKLKYLLSERKIKVIPHSIKLSEMEVTKQGLFRDLYGIDKDEEVLLYVGKLTKDKGVLFLLNAFDKIVKRSPKPIRVIIFGRGPYEGEVKTFARKLGDRVILITQYLSKNDLANLYGSASIFVMPSIYEPTISTACLEALSVGLPSVVSNINCHRELASKGISYPVDIFKMPDSLVDAVNTVILDDHLRRRMKSKALLARQSFSWEKNSPLTEEVYKQINRY